MKKYNKHIEKKGISVVISAYESENFIEECLDSIEKQTYFENYENYEILLGIDGCKKTLEKVKIIKNKYRNLKLYWFEENSGHYLVFNTLIKLYSNYEIITIFGADDIMLKNHIEENLKLLDEKSLVQSICRNKRGKKMLDLLKTNGVIFIYKSIFLDLKGFDNWRCAADSDLLKRLVKININLKSPQKIFFYKKNT